MTRFPSRPRGAVCVLAVLTTLAVLTGACARRSTAGAVAGPPAVSLARRGPSRPQTAAGRGTIVGTALTLRGVPYRNGGSDPGGFDCSGFTQYVFARSGIALPRSVEEQFDEGKKVKPRDLSSGDLVFFKTTSRGALSRRHRHRRRPVHPRAELEGRRARRAPQRRLLVEAVHRRPASELAPTERIAYSFRGRSIDSS